MCIFGGRGAYSYLGKQMVEANEVVGEEVVWARLRKADFTSGVSGRPVSAYLP